MKKKFNSNDNIYILEKEISMEKPWMVIMGINNKLEKQGRKTIVNIKKFLIMAENNAKI